MDWFIVREGERDGPHSRDDLAAMAAEGTLEREDLVWNEALGENQPAWAVGGIFPREDEAREDKEEPAPSRKREPSAVALRIEDLMARAEVAGERFETRVRAAAADAASQAARSPFGATLSGKRAALSESDIIEQDALRRIARFREELNEPWWDGGAYLAGEAEADRRSYSRARLLYGKGV